MENQQELLPDLALRQSQAHFGVIWKAWVGMGDTRKLIQKELTFTNPILFKRYLEQLWVSEGFEDYVAGWNLQGVLTPENLDALSVPVVEGDGA